MFAAQDVREVCRDVMEPHSGNGVMLDFGVVEKLFRNAATSQHTDGGIDTACFHLVKGMFPQTTGKHRRSSLD